MKATEILEGIRKILFTEEKPEVVNEAEVVVETEVKAEETVEEVVKEVVLPDYSAQIDALQARIAALEEEKANFSAVKQAFEADKTAKDEAFKQLLSLVEELAKAPTAEPTEKVVDPLLKKVDKEARINELADAFQSIRKEIKN